MVMPSVEPYIFLLIQINMRDETPSGMDHLKMWRVDAAIAAYRGNESTIDESGIDRTTFRLAMEFLCDVLLRGAERTQNDICGRHAGQQRRASQTNLKEELLCHKWTRSSAACRAEHCCGRVPGWPAVPRCRPR